MAFPRQKITAGVDKNYFRRLTVTDTDFPDASQVLFGITGHITTFSLINESNETIEYSFNGSTLHGDLVPNTPSEALSFSNRPVSKIWFRAPANAVIRVEAWVI